MASTPPTRHRGRPLTDQTKLSDREAAFVAEYLVDFKAIRAARAVGYKGPHVNVTVYKVLARPHVQAAIATAMETRLARLELTADRALKDIDTAANLPIGELFDEAGNLRAVHHLPLHVQRCIVSLKVVKRNLTSGDGIIDQLYEVKLIDKGKMHEILAKSLGLYSDATKDDRPPVPAFALPSDTTGVSVH